MQIGVCKCVMAPLVDTDYDGFWGAPTSTIDWCESNYQVSHYLAEFCKFLYLNDFCVHKKLVKRVRIRVQQLNK